MKIFYIGVVLAIATSTAFAQTRLSRNQCMDESAKDSTTKLASRSLLAIKVGDYRNGCELNQQLITKLESCKPYYSKDLYDRLIDMAYSNAEMTCKCARTNACQ